MRVFTLELQNRRVFGFLSGHASSGIVTMIWKITLAYGGGPIVSMRQGSSRSSMVVLSGGGHQWSLHPLSGRTEVSSPFSLPPRKAGCLMPPDLSGIGRFRTIFMLRQQSIQRLIGDANWAKWPQKTASYCWWVSWKQKRKQDKDDRI